MLRPLLMYMAHKLDAMLRARWAGFRFLARETFTSTSRLLTRPRPQPQPQPRLNWTWRFSRSRILRYCTEVHDARRRGLKGPVKLQARIFGSIFMSIGLLVLNEGLDWNTRVSKALAVVDYIWDEENDTKKFKKFSRACSEILSTYSGEQVFTFNDPIPIPPGSGWGSELQASIFTTPDPEVQGGVLVLCAAFVWDWALHNSDTNSLTDAALTLIPGIESFANTLPQSPRVRGGLIILHHSDDFKSLYWDGKRWINVLFLEWQDAESMKWALGQSESSEDSDQDDSVE